MGTSLDSLLAFVPRNDAPFVAVRDPLVLLGWAETLAVGVDFERSVALQEARDDYNAFVKLAAEQGIDFRRGMLLLPDQEILVFSTAADAHVLAKAIRAAGFKRQPPAECTHLDDDFVACGPSRAALESVQRYEQGPSIRALFGSRLSGTKVDEIAAVARGSGELGLLFAVSVDGSRLQIVAGIEKKAVGGEFLFSAGPLPKGLSLLSPQTPFAWYSVSAQKLQEVVVADAPEALAAASSLTGEVMLGVLRDGSLALLLGVTDPASAAGLVTAGALKSRLLENKPEGVVVDTQSFSGGESKVSALRVRFESGRVARVAPMFGLRPTALGFSAGGYAGVVGGGTADSVRAVATHTPEAAHGHDLPAGLAGVLASGRCFMALHVPMDGLVSGLGRKLFGLVFSEFGEAQAQTSQAVEDVLDHLSAVSSVSAWGELVDEQVVLGIEVDLLVEPASEEGRAAQQGLANIRGGDSPSEVFDALAERYPDSPRAERYRVRAGRSATQVWSALLVGAVAGVGTLDQNLYESAPR
jgi:hypothetical protein